MAQGPQNAVVGDEHGIDLPVMEVPQEDLAREKNMAKFSQSQEFQVLKQHLEDRITFYQTRLPDGTPIIDKPQSAIDVNDWKVANLVITEFRAVIDAYDNARQVVEAASKKK